MAVSRCRVLQGALKRHTTVSQAGRATTLTAPRTVLLKTSHVVLQVASRNDPKIRSPNNARSQCDPQFEIRTAKALACIQMHVP